jgi:hypothetical protein
MKKTFVLSAILTVVIALGSCNKNNGCPNSSDKAVVRDFTDSDTCGIVFQLEDGTKLEPMNLSEFQTLELFEGQWIWLKYKNESGSSTCQLGDVVRIQCISEREF